MDQMFIYGRPSAKGTNEYYTPTGDSRIPSEIVNAPTNQQQNQYFANQSNNLGQQQYPYLKIVEQQRQLEEQQRQQQEQEKEKEKAQDQKKREMDLQAQGLSRFQEQQRQVQQKQKESDNHYQIRLQEEQRQKELKAQQEQRVLWEQSEKQKQAQATTNIEYPERPLFTINEKGEKVYDAQALIAHGQKSVYIVQSNNNKIKKISMANILPT